MYIRILVLLIFLFPGFIYSQGTDQVASGKPFVTIFANFHKGITGSATDEAAFALERGYIGYEYYFSQEFYGKINVDVGSPDDISPYSKIRRYAYFKNAFLRYAKNQLQVEFGLISLKQFSLQEKIWEKRYLMKTIADEHRLGSSADLGLNLNYSFGEKISADLSITNGEGYTSLQMDNIFKYSFAAKVKFPDNFVSGIGYDLMHKEITESTMFIFSSYDFRSGWNIAGEFIMKQNYGWYEHHDIFGFSVFGKYNLNSRYQLFARYDKISSNILEGEVNPWHLSDDGTALIAGIQYSPLKNIKFALNYKDWYPRASNIEGGGFIYFDLELKM